MFSFDDDPILDATGSRADILSQIIKIKVVGVGGGGCNAVTHMVEHGVTGIEFVCINTDRPALNASKADAKLQIGEALTNGKGAGSDPEIGRKSAEESNHTIRKIFEGVDLVFITAGMGGGTGTGAAPIVAEIARDCGVLTVGVVTRPFKFEGGRKTRVADEGIEALQKNVDTLIVIPNEKLRDVSIDKITLANAFGVVDGVLRQAVVGIADLLRSTNFINVDFADLRTILKDAGYAHMGVGEANGKNKVVEAATQAIQSPLMETSIRGAKRILLRITGSPDLLYEEVEDVASAVKEAGHSEANIIFGVDFDANLRDTLRIIVVATDFDETGSGGFDLLAVSKTEPTNSPRPATPAREPSRVQPIDTSDGEDDWQEMDRLLKELGISGNNR